VSIFPTSNAVYSTRGDHSVTSAQASPASEDSLHCLISLTASGDPVAFTALYNALAHEVRSLARHWLDETEAANVTRAVFVEVWHLAGLYQPGWETVRGWVLRIAGQRAADRARSKPNEGQIAEFIRICDQKTEGELAALLAPAARNQRHQSVIGGRPV
jgi:DNA-directed RNA polymerase specialized sigma24 family protein